MNRIGCAALAAVLSLSACPAWAKPASSAAEGSASIAAIRAQLYYEETGAFSDDILARKELALWNTVIGEGDAERASNATLVAVEIRGKKLALGALKVEIVARGDKGRVVAKRLIDVALYDEKTTFFAPLWLHDTGCEAIEVSARLVGKGAPAATVKKVIPFACGE